MSGSRRVATAKAGDVCVGYESFAVNLLRVLELGELPPYVYISALHDVVGKMRNCGIRHAEGEIRNGLE